MAKSNRAKAKDTAWKWFSLYIRLRDCQRTGGRYGRCITCQTPLLITEGDAGHFVPSRADSILFEETNCHLQCRRCNRFRQGEFVKYEFALREMYGEEEVERLKQLTKTVKKYSAEDYRNIANIYREKYHALKGK